LDRKNNELEDMRSEHQLKVAQLESLNQRLERKLNQLERESAHLQELRDKEASDSRQAAKILRQQLQTDFDKKVQNVIKKSEFFLISALIFGFI
jgi:Skp family chaperone for outer membrane proteins